MPPKVPVGLLTQNRAFPTASWVRLGPGKMPPLLKNDSKSEPLLPEEVGVMGGGDLTLPPF